MASADRSIAEGGRSRPRALTIAGSDSGGGAGIQADLKTFAAFGVYGASAITAVTAQHTLGVQAIHEVPADVVAAQIEAVLSDIGADAVKTGMLFSTAIIEVVTDRLVVVAWCLSRPPYTSAIPLGCRRHPEATRGRAVTAADGYSLEWGHDRRTADATWLSPGRVNQRRLEPFRPVPTSRSRPSP